MLYNSTPFVFFFIAVYTLYLFLRKRRPQNILLLAASYFFYGVWSWKYLCLLMAATLTSYYAGLEIERNTESSGKKKFLWAGIGANLVILFIFKYYNFFLENFDALLNVLGVPARLPLLNVILPIGISFYTFQAIGYVLDIYRGRVAAFRNLGDYALFIAFFPQLLAGPIARAEHLVPQVLSERRLSRVQTGEGLYLIAWGMFQKVFIADNLASRVDAVFSAGAPASGVESLLICYAFTFQIFFDFAGYSNIARGLAKMMGFELMINFNLPYLAVNIQDFWNRWHISLSSWVKDYLYTPLFLSLRLENAKARAYGAVLLSMLLMGLWHGAGWTFIVFGLYHGILLVLYAMLRPALAGIRFSSGFKKSLWFMMRVVFIFHLVAIGMLLFRAQSLHQAAVFLSKILFDFQAGGTDLALTLASYGGWGLLGWAWPLIRKGHFLKPGLLQDMACGFSTGILVYFVLLYGGSGKAFIYFQF